MDIKNPSLVKEQAVTHPEPSHETQEVPALFGWPLLIFLLAAAVVLVPFLFYGEASGHDFEFHLHSWMEVLLQWKQGIVYPRWASLAHYGYGEARFVFYPPASWILGAALGAFLPWIIAPAAYIWITLTLAGCSMFLLARRWLERGDAIFAAALYAVNPYHLVIVYWRSAFAELLAGVLLPLLLLWVLQIEEVGRRAILPLAVIVAAAWLMNAPAAVMVNYSLALLLVVVAVLRRSPRVLLHGAAAILLGLALAAFYVLPAAYEEKWVAIAQVLAPGVRPVDNFLFTLINDPEHNVFNLLVSAVACAEIVLLAGAALFSGKLRRGRGLWWGPVVWAAAASFLMFSASRLFWDVLPKLRFIQLPWRWLLCLNVAFALLVTMACRRWTSRTLVCTAVLAVLAFGWIRWQPPWWDRQADLTEMQRSVLIEGYEGTDEYVPVDADPYEIDRHAPRVGLESAGKAHVTIRQWAPESRAFDIQATAPEKLVLRLLNYPAWKVEVNGKPVAAETREVTGQMVIPVAAGESRVNIRFTRTWDRTAGGVISLLTLAGVVVMVVVQRRP